MDAMQVQRQFVAVMAKHLPPSASTLHLLDLDGRSGQLLSPMRADLRVSHMSPEAVCRAGVSADSIDAAIAYDIALSPTILQSVLDALRPGGRLIALQSRGAVNESQPRLLSDNGYVRILVEPALDGLGVLLRGEKPHETADTAKRIQSVARADADCIHLDNYRGRNLHLLIQQQPNKPAWKLTAADTISWRAVAIERAAKPVLLAFSSLPKAVGFMQSAVLAGLVSDVNKVGKFSRDSAANWLWDAILNPTLESVRFEAFVSVDIDPASAEAPDE